MSSKLRTLTHLPRQIRWHPNCPSSSPLQSPLCSNCHNPLPIPIPLLLSPLPSTTRPLTTTPRPSKSGGKQHSKRTIPHNASIINTTSPTSSSSPSSKNNNTNPRSAFDFTPYETAITSAHEALKTELSRINAGGKADPEAVEGLKVVLSKPGIGGGGGKSVGGKGEKGKDWVRLGDLASVVPRGRNLVILVGEKEHIKPITTALSHTSSPNPSSSSPLPFNLPPPQSSPTDPLTLTIPIPPTTQESRIQAQALASKKGEETLFELREARGVQRKRLRKMELGRIIGPDEAKRVEREMEGRNEGAVREVRGCVERCRRGLQR